LGTLSERRKKILKREETGEVKSGPVARKLRGLTLFNNRNNFNG